MIGQHIAYKWMMNEAEFYLSIDNLSSIDVGETNQAISINVAQSSISFSLSLFNCNFFIYRCFIDVIDVFFVIKMFKLMRNKEECNLSIEEVDSSQKHR